MDFKELANKILNEGEETPKVVDVDSVDSILESLDQKMNESESTEFDSSSSDKAEKKFKKDAKEAKKYVESDPNELVVDMGKGMKAPKNVNETVSPKFLGKLNYTPNPLEYPVGTTYKNINEGTVYIRSEGENLWESLVSDGKPGKNAYPSGGGGLGIRDVNSAVATQLASGNITDLNVVIAPGTLVGFPGSPIEADGNINSYFQVIEQNQSSGTIASTDFVATSNAGSDTNLYIDMGINGSGFSQSATGWYVNGANDGYLYTQGGNLAIGTSTSGAQIVIFVGGTSASNIQATVTTSGYTFVNNITVPNILYGTSVVTSSVQLTNTSNNQQVVSAAGTTVKLPVSPINGIDFAIFNRNNAYTLSAAQQIYYNGSAAASQSITSGTNILFVCFEGTYWAAK